MFTFAQEFAKNDKVVCKNEQARMTSLPNPSESRTLPLEWNDLAVILAIGRAGSLAGAARTLGQTHSTVFRKINAIEERCGVRFFDRFASGYVATRVGETAMLYGERIEGEMHAFGLEVLGRDAELRGRVRLTSMETFANEIAPGILARFAQAYPEIYVDLSPGVGAVDLSRREAEVAVRATRKPPDTSFGRRICDFRFAAYGTPDYLAAADPGMPLSQHRWSLIEGTVTWLVPILWKTREEGESRAHFQSRSSRAVQNAGAEGMGLTLLPCYAGDADPRLVRATDPIPQLDLGLWVLTHPDLQKTARVRALMRHLYAELERDADLYRADRPQPGGYALPLA